MTFDEVLDLVVPNDSFIQDPIEFEEAFISADGERKSLGQGLYFRTQPGWRRAPNGE